MQLPYGQTKRIYDLIHMCGVSSPLPLLLCVYLAAQEHPACKVPSNELSQIAPSCLSVPGILPQVPTAALCNSTQPCLNTTIKVATGMLSWTQNFKMYLLSLTQQHIACTMKRPIN